MIFVVDSVTWEHMLVDAGAAAVAGKAMELAQGENVT